MSRRGRSSAHTNNANPVMGPPPDRDTVMGPPPVPSPTQPVPGQQQQKGKESGEIIEKYRKLKRRYFELDEKYKETSSELQRSGERNVRMREERNILLDRIIELETQPSSKPNGSTSSPPHQPANPQPTSTAFPRALLSSRARSSFVSNLREAVAEDDMNVDEEVDPLLTSRHVGPVARKRAAEEKRERMEEEARELRRSSRRGRSSQQAGGSKGKDVQSSAGNGASPSVDPAPTLVSSTGTRLRIKPPAPPQSEAGPSGAHNGMVASGSGSGSSASSTKSSRPNSHSNANNSHAHPEDRSESPSTPVVDHHGDNGSGGGDYSPPQTKYSSPTAPHTSPPASAPAHSPTSDHATSQPQVRPDTPTQSSQASNASSQSAPPTHTTSTPTPTSHAPAPSPHYRYGHSQSPAMSLRASSTKPSDATSPPSSSNSPSTSQSASQAGGAPVQRHAKPKRLKAHTVTTKSFSIPMVPRDKDGAPMLPLNVGIMTVLKLGKVCMREHFHTERYIFPVGYEVTRRYHSTISPDQEVVYHCSILDGGDGPKFQIIPADVPEKLVIAGTATGAWSNIVKQANAIRNRQHSNSVSGPDFFGLGQNTIKHLIQELPGADRLRDYVWQNFVEGGPLGGRHAAVIPALPEEYDSALSIGAFFPNERDRREVERLKRAPYKEESGMSIMIPSSPQSQQQQPPQTGLQTIVLPPPTTSETLTIQEYQPPPPKENDKRRTRNGSPPRQPRKTSPSPQPRNDYYRTRSDSSTTVRSAKVQAQSPSPPIPGPSSQPLHSPYLASTNASSSAATPPPVPATFASIMNAYPAPTSGATSDGQASVSEKRTNGSGSVTSE